MSTTVNGMGHRLRSAMLRAQLDAAGLAAAVSVDVKTVNRWLAGRLPHQRTRLAVADLLGETEADLWPRARPDLAPGSEATAEVVGAYAHRADIPNTSGPRCSPAPPSASTCSATPIPSSSNYYRTPWPVWVTRPHPAPGCG
jgi:hypothetical protein